MFFVNNFCSANKAFLHISMIALVAILCQGQCYSSDQWDPTQPVGSASPSDLDTLIPTNNNVVDRLVSDFRENLKLSYASATTITVAVGQVTCDNAARTTRKWRENVAVLTLGWADIDTGGEATSTTYYVYAVADTDATTFTGVISINGTTPTGATYYKRLGSFFNNSSGDIVNSNTLTNDSDYFSLSLGSWVSKSAGVTYQASTDGFVTVVGTALGGDAVRGKFYTDATTPPTTERGVVFAATDNERDSMGCKVKKGDYYLMTFTNGTSDSMYFIPSE